MVPALISGVEAVFTKPASGQNKMDAVTQALRAILAKMAAVGTLPAPPQTPTDETLQAMIETVLQGMKSSGQLGATPIATLPAPGFALGLDAGGFVGDLFASLGKRVAAK